MTINVTKPPDYTNSRDLAHNQYYDQGCVCSWLLGYNVDPNHPNEWAEQLISPDEECVRNGHRGRSK